MISQTYPVIPLMQTQGYQNIEDKQKLYFTGVNTNTGILRLVLFL